MNTVWLVPRQTATAAAGLPLVLRGIPTASTLAEIGACCRQRHKRWLLTGGALHARFLQQHQLFQVEYFHKVAENSDPRSKNHRLPSRLPAADSPPLPTTQAGDLPQSCIDTSCRCADSSSSSSAIVNADQQDPTASADFGLGPPSGPQEETVTVYGRRRRHSRQITTATTPSSSSSSTADSNVCKQQKSTCLVTGRRRGRAARSCFKATAAWLGALLPQGSAAAAAPENSTAAAIAFLARGASRGRAAAPPAAVGARRQVPTQQPEATAAEGSSLPAPTQFPTSDDKGAADTAAAAAAEAGVQQEIAATPSTAGRRRRSGSAGFLGSSKSPEVSAGGAINFQFPVLFNVAIKRLLKALLRRAGQPQRRTGSRTAAAAAAAAPAGARGGQQRPPLPPRVLLKSWRPLSRASWAGGPRQNVRCRQQHQLQQQALQQLQQVHQQQQQQEQDVADSHVLPQQAPAELHASVSEGGEAAVTAAQQEEQYQELPTPDKAFPCSSAAVPAAAAAAVDTAKADILEARQGEARRQENGSSGPADSAAPAVAPAAAATGEQQAEQQEQASLKPAAAAPSESQRAAVGRGAPRAAHPRASRSMRFLCLSADATYGRLQCLLSPYSASISEWLYRNGNVVVTLGSLLSLTATLMADMRLLRTFNLLAGLCYFSYNWSRRPRLADAALWNVVFLVLNMVMLWRVYTEHREVAFSSNELDIFQQYFLPAGMSPRQFRRLLRQGTWRTLPQGFLLQQEGSSCDSLCFVVRGTVEISQGGETVETYRGGEAGAVVGVEPFFSYVAALRKRAAKRNAQAAPTPPETLDSHADESPDHRQQQLQQQQIRQRGHAEEKSLEQQQQQQPRQNACKDQPANNNTAADAHPASSAVAAPAADVGEQKPQQQQQTGLLDLLNGAVEGVNAGVAADAAAANGLRDSPGGINATNSFVIAAAEAAATAAAAVRTVATTALTNDVRTPEQQQTAETPLKASPAAGVGGVVESPGAQESQQADSAAAAVTAAAATATAAAAAAAAADAAAQTDAAEGKEMAVQVGDKEKQQQQLFQRMKAAAKGEAEGSEGRPGDDVLTAPYTAICTTEATVFSLDVKEFAAFVLREPENLAFPVVQGLTTLLVNRSRAQAARIALHSYDAFLAGVFADGIVQTDERKLLEEFRRKRAISQAQHEQALARLGWTPEEFERGSQSGTGVFSRLAVSLGALLRGGPTGYPEEAADMQQPQQNNHDITGLIEATAASPANIPLLFEDWEIVEDAHAVRPHPTAETHEEPLRPTDALEAPPLSGASEAAISYAFEEEAVALGYPGTSV